MNVAFLPCALLLCLPARAQGLANLSFEPSTSHVAVLDVVEIALVATAQDDTPTNIGALDAVLLYDASVLELLGSDQSMAGYAWFVAGFLPDPDGLNADLTDGDAIFTALAQIATPAVAPPPPGLQATDLRFRALAPSAGTQVVLAPTLGTFARTRVVDFFIPGLDITGNISSVATVVVDGGANTYCTGTAALCPCGNGGGPRAGCGNSTGSGAGITSSGTTSLAADDLVLTVTPVPVFQFGIVYTGEGMLEVPFGDGLRCIAPGPGSIVRFPVTNAGAGGALISGPGLIGALGSFNPIDAGETWSFQGWYRDPAGPCGSAFNLSNAVSLTFAP